MPVFPESDKHYNFPTNIVFSNKIGKLFVDQYLEHKTDNFFINLEYKYNDPSLESEYIIQQRNKININFNELKKQCEISPNRNDKRNFYNISIKEINKEIEEIIKDIK